LGLKKMKIRSMLVGSLLEDIHALRPCSQAEWDVFLAHLPSGAARRDVPSGLSFVRQILLHGKVIGQKTTQFKGGRPVATSYMKDPSY